MADEHEQGTGARRGNSSRRRSSPARDRDKSADEAVTKDAASTEHVEEAKAQAEAAQLTHEPEPAQAPDPADDGGAVVPPPPPTEHADAAAEAEDSENVPYPKDVLLARSLRLLGVEPSLARGVLAEADDPISIADAKARIRAVLDQPVTGIDHDDQESNR